MPTIPPGKAFALEGAAVDTAAEGHVAADGGMDPREGGEAFGAQQGGLACRWPPVGNPAVGLDALVTSGAEAHLEVEAGEEVEAGRQEFAGGIQPRLRQATVGSTCEPMQAAMGL